MLPRVNRITKETDFDLLKKEGIAIGSNIVTLLYKTNNVSIPRFGIIVSTKVSKKAVNRNTTKRIIRKILKLIVSDVKPFDYLVILRKDLSEVKKEIVEKILKEMFAKVK